jgi:diguanylate cyclase (GGDEF)-like protein
MTILVVDDSEDSRLLIQRFLQEEGHREFLMAGSVPEALGLLAADAPAPPSPVELIMMDLQLPGPDGIEGCRRISADPRLRDIPVIVVTASKEHHNLPAAFQAGAVDYLLKPVNPLELGARVRSVLRLKREMDQRKQREAELIEATYKLAAAKSELQRLSSLDGLTGITNRRRFDELLEQETKRSTRDATFLSLILVDIDAFKPYNDRYGHLAGDECLKKVAVALRDSVQRAGDAVARYGGEEFVAILPATDGAGAKAVAEAMRRAVESLNVEHAASPAGSRVTVSLGVATGILDEKAVPAALIDAADQALYESKKAGRNRVSTRLLERGTRSRRP